MYKWIISHMYRACHVIYTIITISTAWYFSQSPLMSPNHSQFILEHVFQLNPSKHGLRVPLFERKSTHIASVPDVIIVGVLNVSCPESEKLVHWGSLHHANTPRCEILEVTSTDSRGHPHHVCGVALSSTHLMSDASMTMWITCISSNKTTESTETSSSPNTRQSENSRGGSHRFKRWPPPHIGVMWHFTPCGT